MLALSVQTVEFAHRKLATLRRAARDEHGVTALEYGLIAALIAVVIVASVKLVGTRLASTFSQIATSV